jgi:uncharacterized membrane protein YccC
MAPPSKTPFRFGGFTLEDARTSFIPTPKSVRFAVRVTTAAMLSFFIARGLGYHEAYWAIVTSWILAIPGRGLVFSKAFYRITGTVIGGIAAFFMLPLAGQTLLFFTILSLWVGVCAFIARLFRRLETYAAQLSGYTAALIATSGIAAHNNNAQYFAKERIIVVFIGIITTSVIAWFFAEPTDEKDLHAQAKKLAHKSTLGMTAFLNTDLNRELWVGISDFQSNTAYAAIESSTIRKRMPAIRRLTAFQISLISSVRAVKKIAKSIQVDKAFLEHELKNASECFLNGVPATNEIAMIRERAKLLVEDVSDQNLVKVALRDRAMAIADALEGIGCDLDSFKSPPVKTPSPKTTAIHRDYIASVDIGVRAFISTLLMGLFWIQTNWIGGGLAFVFTCVAVTLFGVLPRPIVGISRYAISVVILVLTFSLWHLLPLGITADFVVTAVVTTLISLVCAVGIYNRFSPMMDYLVNFSALMLGVGTSIVGVFPALNLTLGLFIGVVIAGVVFEIPTMSRKRRVALARKTIRSYLRKLATGRLELAPIEWETKMYDFIVETPLTAKNNKESMVFLREAIISMDLGLEIIRLREIYNTLPPHHNIALVIVNALMSLGRDLHPNDLRINLRNDAASLLKLSRESSNSIYEKRAFKAASIIESLIV